MKMLVFQTPNGVRSQPVEADSAAAKIFTKSGWVVIETIDTEAVLVDPSDDLKGGPIAPPREDGSPDLPEGALDLLKDAGFAYPDGIRAASDAELLAIKGIGKGTLAKLRAIFGEAEDADGADDSELPNEE